MTKVHLVCHTCANGGVIGVENLFKSRNGAGYAKLQHLNSCPDHDVEYERIA